MGCVRVEEIGRDLMPPAPATRARPPRRGGRPWRTTPLPVAAHPLGPAAERVAGRAVMDGQDYPVSPAKAWDDRTGSERRLLADALRKVAEGDRRAFEDVYRRSAPKLFGVCLRVLPERSQAEEALQNAYLAVWQRAGSFQEARGTAMTWLIAIARNSAIDRRRARGAAATAPIELAAGIADTEPSAFDHLRAGEEERRLIACLHELHAGDADLVRTAFLEGVTYSDLASRAGSPLGTIKSRIRRALLKLRDCLA